MPLYVVIFSYLMLCFAIFRYLPQRFAPPQNEIVNEIMSEVEELPETLPTLRRNGCSSKLSALHMLMHSLTIPPSPQPSPAGGEGTSSFPSFVRRDSRANAALFAWLSQIRGSKNDWKSTADQL